MRSDGRQTMGQPWMLDIGANLLAITIVLLIVSGLQTRSGRSPDPVAIETAPLGRAEIVDMLYSRIYGADGSYADLRAEGLGGAPGARDLFVFDAEPLSGLEFTSTTRILPVPEALRGPNGQDWSSEFLALGQQGLGREAFVTALADLLAGTSEAIGAEAPAPARRYTDFVPRWQAIGNAICAGFAALLLLRLARRVGRVKAAGAVGPDGGHRR